MQRSHQCRTGKLILITLLLPPLSLYTYCYLSLPQSSYLIPPTSTSQLSLATALQPIYYYISLAIFCYNCLILTTSPHYFTTSASLYISLLTTKSKNTSPTCSRKNRLSSSIHFTLLTQSVHAIPINIRRESISKYIWPSQNKRETQELLILILHVWTLNSIISQCICLLLVHT